MDIYAKLQVYDRDASTPGWVDAYYIPADWIVGVECTFLAYRCEKSARLTFQDRGKQESTGSPTQDIRSLESIHRKAGALYRINIYSEDPETEMTDFPAGWYDLMIYWGGLVDGITTSESEGSRTIEITAVGFTQHLSSMVRNTTDAAVDGFSSGTTLLSALTSLYINDLIPLWPQNSASLVSITVDVTGTIATQTLPSDVGSGGYNLLSVLQSFASLGNYFIGMRVSGYPTVDASEFTLVFLESRTVVETNDDTRDIHYTYHTGDRNVLEASLQADQFEYHNQWLMRGVVPSQELIITPVGFATTAQKNGDGVAQFTVNDLESGFRPEAFNEGSPTLTQSWYDSAITSVRVAVQVTEAYPGDGVTRVGGYLDDDQPFDANYSPVRGASGAYVTDPIPIDSAVYGVSSLAPTVTTFYLRDGPASWTQLSSGGPGGLEWFYVGGADTSDPDRSVVMRFACLRPLATTVSSVNDSDALRPKVISDTAMASEVDMVLTAVRDMWIERTQSLSGTLVVANQWRLPVGRTSNKIAIMTDEDRSTIMLNAGGVFADGDDDRPVGGGKVFNVQQVLCEWQESGWQYTYSLGAAAIELSTVILPTSSRSVI